MCRLCGKWFLGYLEKRLKKQRLAWHVHASHHTVLACCVPMQVHEATLSCVAWSTARQAYRFRTLSTTCPDMVGRYHVGWRTRMGQSSVEVIMLLSSQPANCEPFTVEAGAAAPAAGGTHGSSQGAATRPVDAEPMLGLVSSMPQDQVEPQQAAAAPAGSCGGGSGQQRAHPAAQVHASDAGPCTQGAGTAAGPHAGSRGCYFPLKRVCCFQSPSIRAVVPRELMAAVFPACGPHADKEVRASMLVEVDGAVQSQVRHEHALHMCLLGEGCAFVLSRHGLAHGLAAVLSCPVGPLQLEACLPALKLKKRCRLASISARNGLTLSACLPD